MLIASGTIALIVGSQLDVNHLFELRGRGAFYLSSASLLFSFPLTYILRHPQAGTHTVNFFIEGFFFPFSRQPKEDLS